MQLKLYIITDTTDNPSDLNFCQLYTVDVDGNICGLGVKMEEGESLIDALARTDYLRGMSSRDRLRELQAELVPYTYSSRVFRPQFAVIQADASSPFCLLGRVSSPINNSTVNTSIRQIHTLISRLESIFNVVEPHDQNVEVFGHEIRNLILIACTEVEAQAKGILKANNVRPIRHDFGMRDYHKLLGAMYLDEYEVKMPLYPLLAKRAPFANWSPLRLSSGQWMTGLNWYDAYNAIKHDREQQFHQSKLSYAIDAVLACVVLLEAQFGYDLPWSEYAPLRFEFVARPHLTPICCHQEGVYASVAPPGAEEPETPRNVNWIHEDYAF